MKSLHKLLSLAIGTCLMALAINGLLVPHGLLGGGVSGIALFLHLVAGTSLSLLTIGLNIPLFILAIKFLKKNFIIYSLIGMLMLSFWLEVTKSFVIPTEEYITIILLSGLLNGLGVGIIFRAGGSVGGTDIIAKILNQSFSLSMGGVVFSINLFIMLGSVLVFSVDIAVITLASMFVSTQTTNFVVDGLNRRRTVTIITSPQLGELISQDIITAMNRGVTIVPALGGYTQQDKSILYTTVNIREVAKLKHIVQSYDAHAFVTVADTAQVIGNGKGFLPLNEQ